MCPVENGEAEEAAAPFTTYMDDRTVVPSGFSDAPPLTAKPPFPHIFRWAYWSIARSFRAAWHPTPAKYGPSGRTRSLAILDSRVVVPAYVETPEQKEIDKFDQPPEMTEQLREVVEPDIFLTGDANLLDRARGQAATPRQTPSPAPLPCWRTSADRLSDLPAQNVSAARAHASEIAMAKRNSTSSICRRTPVNFPAAFAASRPRGENQPENVESSRAAAAGGTCHRGASSAEPGAPAFGFARSPHAAAQSDAASAQPLPRRLWTPRRRHHASARAPQPIPGHLNLGLSSSSPGKAIQDQLQERSSTPAVERIARAAVFREALAAGGGRGGGGGTGRQRRHDTTPTEGVDFNSYIARLVARVKRNWMP